MRFVVYNPQSNGGATGRHWLEIAKLVEAAIGPFSSAPTRCRDDAARLVREAVANGAQEVVAVGGDGTISEAINGLFGAELPSRSQIVFGFVSCGTGEDFRRALGIAPGIRAACERLASGRTRWIDIGRLTFLDDRLQHTVRYFSNIASLGLSGSISKAVNGAGLTRLLGARAMFRYHSVAELLRYSFPTVRVTVDENQQFEGPVATVVVANGSHFGGGMHIAPMADPADGQLDIVVVKGESKSQLVAAMGLVYTGQHLRHSAVQIMRGRRIVAEPLVLDRPVLLDVDGEVPGRLPATFEVQPFALMVRC